VLVGLVVGLISTDWSGWGDGLCWKVPNNFCL